MSFNVLSARPRRFTLSSSSEDEPIIGEIGSRRKIAQLTGLDFDPQRPAASSPLSAKFISLSGYEPRGEYDVSLVEEDQEPPPPATPSSIYSQEGLEHIIAAYERWYSEPGDDECNYDTAIPGQQQDDEVVVPRASGADLTTLQPTARPLESLRHRDRPSTPVDRSSGTAELPTSERSMGPETLLTFESGSLFSEGFNGVDWKNNHHRIRVHEEDRAGDYSMGAINADVSHLVPQHLSLRFKTANPKYPVSHFSDHSSESAGRDEGLMSHARESFLSQVRAISDSSPFTAGNNTSVTFRDRPPTIPEKSSKRSRGTFSSAKHPLKSPYPFSSPLRGRSHVIETCRPDEEAVPHPHRLSDAIKWPRNSNTNRVGDPRILYTHQRQSQGPDTPYPDLEMNPRRRLRLGPTTLIQKSSQQIWDKMKSVGSQVKPKPERDSDGKKRREILRKSITVLGSVDAERYEVGKPLKPLKIVRERMDLWV
ncbi:MAG: hypothetical protein M1818_001600 [Claussenomyces sp. TS43310]|nr:MAG: hypothetical protein M1818_001600 [Claussenomyces sp. TS43310]